MKKALVLLICVAIVLTMTACGESTKATDTVTETAKPVQMKKASPTASNRIETAEGITILSTSNYMLGPEGGGQFYFMLSEEGRESDKIEWTIQVVASAHIYLVEYYDDNGNMISCEQVDGIASVPQEVENKYIESFIIYMEQNDILYSATFIRGGY